MDKTISPIASMSGNDRARFVDVIRSAEREHWFSGLRQAELEISGIEERLKHWNLFDSIRELITKEKSAYRRDAEYQLTVCKEEYKRILDEHPDVENLTYEECQERYSREALTARKSTYLATTQLATAFGINEAAAEMLISSDPNDIPQIIKGSLPKVHLAASKFSLGSGESRVDYAIAMLSSMQNEERQAVLSAVGKTRFTSGHNSLTGETLNEPPTGVALVPEFQYPLQNNRSRG